MLNKDHTTKKIIESIMSCPVSIKPVGHHELGRHLVYHVTDDNGLSVIFKLYYKKNRWNREVASLKLLTGSGVLCPGIKSYGILDDGTEWIIFEYLDGECFENIKNIIDENGRRNILFELGNELGKIHSFKVFDFFGTWDENGKSIYNIKNFKESFIKTTGVTLDMLFAQHLPEEALQKKAARQLKKQYDILDCVKESRLCHNDFDARNILVKKYPYGWKLAGIVDFEQCFPSDRDRDIVMLYYDFCLRNKENEDAFIKGYNANFYIGEDFYKKLYFYLLYFGLTICSWTYKAAPDYYKKGVKLLEEFAPL